MNVENFTLRGYYIKMNEAATAMSLFKKGVNCTQSLLVTHGTELGIDRKTAFRIASAFGGGMGDTGETCGAVTGAFMIIGLKYGATDAENKKARLKVRKLVGKFIEKFKSRNDSILCRELLGSDIRSSGSGKIAKEKCPKYVKDAIELIEELS